MDDRAVTKKDLAEALAGAFAEFKQEILGTYPGDDPVFSNRSPARL
jgi:hypothetical protein